MHPGILEVFHGNIEMGKVAKDRKSVGEMALTQQVRHRLAAGAQLDLGFMQGPLHFKKGGQDFKLINAYL